MIQEWIPSSRISPIFPEIAQKLHSFLCLGHSTWSPLWIFLNIGLVPIPCHYNLWAKVLDSLALLCSLSPVWLFATPWTRPCRAPLSMGFSRQEYWSRLPFPIFLTQGWNRSPRRLLHWQVDSLPLVHLGSSDWKPSVGNDTAQCSTNQCFRN